MLCAYIEAYNILVVYLVFIQHANKIDSKYIYISGAEKQKYSSMTKTKVKKIKITFSKFFNNLINSNCKRSSNLLIIKNCKFFECIVNSTFTWCDY